MAVRVVIKTGCTIDIRGIDKHRCTNIDIGTVGGVIQTQNGPIIGIMHQYALLNPLFTLLVNLNGTRMMLMTNPSMSQGSPAHLDS
jgi:hypothetical protein